MLTLIAILAFYAVQTTCTIIATDAIMATVYLIAAITFFVGEATLYTRALITIFAVDALSQFLLSNEAPNINFIIKNINNFTSFCSKSENCRCIAI